MSASPPNSQLNRDFYAANPAGHLHTRLNFLTLLAARGDEVTALMEDGATLGEVELKGHTPPSPEALRYYATAEAQTLMHHSVEALLRLYFAHATLPPCPWIELTRLTHFPEVKRRVKQLSGDDWPAEMDEGIEPVFLSFIDAAPAQIAEGRKVIRAFMQIAGTHYLQGAKLYNAIKHGFAVQAGRHRISFGEKDDGSAEFSIEADSVTYLEHTSEGRHRHWDLTTAMMNVDHALAIAAYSVTQIEALWMVARQRYAPTGEPFNVPMLNQANLDVLLRMESDLNRTYFSRHVFDEETGPKR
jgi:hypothetical protein